MKKRFKEIFGKLAVSASALCVGAVFFAFTAMPVMANSPSVKGLWVGDSGEITSEGKVSDHGGTGEATVSINEAGKIVLTLKDFEYEGEGHGGVSYHGGIYYNGSTPLQIRVEGNNTVTQTSDKGNNCAVYVEDSELEISGRGKLSALGSDTYSGNDRSIGICADNALKITGGEIEAVGGNAGDSCGIRCNDIVTMTGGRVKAVGKTGASKSVGIYSQNDKDAITLWGGLLEASGEKYGVDTSEGTVVLAGGIRSDNRR